MRITTKTVKEIHADSIEDCIELVRLVEQYLKDNEGESFYYLPHHYEYPDRKNWLDLLPAVNALKSKLTQLITGIDD